MDTDKAVKVARRFGIDIEAIMKGEIRKLLQKHVDSGGVKVLDTGAGKYELMINVADADGTALGRVYVGGKLGDLVKEFVKVKTDGIDNQKTAAT
ncbi:MAG: hypothetical protein PHV13_02975 [Candidatus ainarchaeum sp.]|nr:hypothetical protein [Candidatus ainarchaeum sp.]